MEHPGLAMTSPLRRSVLAAGRGVRYGNIDYGRAADDVFDMHRPSGDRAWHFLFVDIADTPQ